MQAQFVQEGAYIDYVPVDDLPQGAVVVENNLIGVATRAIKAGELGALAVSGVFDFPKEVGVGGDGFQWGNNAYWDTSTKLARWDAGPTRVALGKVVRAARNEDATVRILLLQVMEP